MATESGMSGSPDDPWASLPALIETARAGGWLIDAAELEVGANRPPGASTRASAAADPAAGGGGNEKWSVDVEVSAPAPMAPSSRPRGPP